jgi:actin-related protein
VVGGTSLLPGYLERLYRSAFCDANMIVRGNSDRWLLQMLSSASIPFRSIFTFNSTDESPITCAWEGASAMASDKKLYKTKVVTRKEYMEYGSNICSSRFDTPKLPQDKDAREDEEMDS